MPWKGSKWWTLSKEFTCSGIWANYNPIFLRIAWFANIDFQEGNAANSRIRALGKGLKERGHQVFLFFLSSTIFNSNGINKKTKGFYDGLYFNYLSGSVKRSRFLWRRMLNYFVAMIKSGILLIKKRDHFDVVFLYNPRFLFFGHIYFLCRILGIPLVIEKTELEQKRKAVNRLHRFINYTDRLDAYLFSHFCSHLVVISDNLKSFYAKYLPSSRITKIPIIVDLKRFPEPGTLSSSYNIGYLGSFGAKDGVNGIISGFKTALKTIPHLRLSLIGFNPYKKEVNLELKRNHLNGEVIKSGQITYDQVPHWLAKCDLLILNRTGDEYARYGFPTKLGEYLASGIPTICTRVGEIGQYLVHNRNSYLIEAGNSAQLAEAIVTRYENYDRFNKMGLEGRQTAQSAFDYLKYIPVLESVFEKVRKQRRGALKN